MICIMKLTNIDMYPNFVGTTRQKNFNFEELLLKSIIAARREMLSTLHCISYRIMAEGKNKKSRTKGTALKKIILRLSNFQHAHLASIEFSLGIF